MKRELSLLLFLTSFTFSQEFFLKPTTAQVTSDGTTNTTVNISGNDFTIEQGDRAGGNLFHSFSEFSVPTDGSAFFNNAVDIVNIFSRVTGGNISNIDGVLLANGTANLFLINPAGIIFGEGARLDIGGSFYGSTADSISFRDGEFSAQDLNNPPLITINAPIGLNFRDNPGEVQVQGSNLEVEPSQTLGVIGGKLSFSGSNLLAPEGRIELGSVSGQGDVSLQFTNLGWELGYENVQNFSDIELTEGAVIDTSGTGGGSIQVQASQVSLLDGSRIVSFTNGSQAGGDLTLNANNFILENGSVFGTITIGEGTGGNVIVNSSESVVVSGGDFVRSILASQTAGNGDAGNLNITTGKLILDNGGQVATTTFGQGSAGNLFVNALELVQLRGTSADGQFSSGLFTDTQGTGNAGDIRIETGKLTVEQGAKVNTIAFRNNVNDISRGDAGDLTIIASELVEVSGISSVVTNFPRSGLNTEANGEANAGNLSIETGNLIVRDGAFISTSTFGEGSGGDLTVKASESVELIGVDGQFTTGLFAETDIGEGRAGNLTIDTGKLIARNGGNVSTSSFGEGQAGNLNINAVESVEFIGTRLNAFGNRVSSGFFSFTNSEKDAGDLTISTKRLLIENGGQAFSGSNGDGQGGNLTVNASEFVKVIGIEQTEGLFGSRLATRTDGNGDAGNLNINTGKLIVQDGGQISGSTFGGGRAGNVIVNASESVEIIGSNEPIGPNDLSTGILAQTGNSESEGNGGNIEINTPNISITDRGVVLANTSNKGNAGNINLNVEDTVILSRAETGVFSRTSEEAIGDGGSISVDTRNLTITDGATVAVDSQGQGNGGIVSITARDLNLDGEASITSSTRAGVGGELTLTIEENLTLRNNSIINAQAFGNANGGIVNVEADFIIAFPSQFDGNDILATAQQGIGGNINITTQGLFNIEERPQNPLTNDIDASSDFGLDGIVSINTPDLDIFQETTEVPAVVESENLGINACSSGKGAEVSSFTVKGKGGIPRQPIESLSSDEILINGQITTLQPQTQYPNIKPIKTSMGDIYPARGIIKTEDGKIILTSYPTDNINTRTPHNLANCTSS
ncbi:MAG: filamentous hemagglutinin N-terminal domain-containing protein [Xenococcus sp. (in: cyanobacteria)]